MHLNRVDYVLWLSSPLVLSLVLLIMCKRRLHVTYPYFVSYSLLQIVSYSVLFELVKRSYAAYYYAYYSILFASAALSIAVFWDIFKNAFQPYPRLRPLPVSIFRYSVVFMVFAMIMIGLLVGRPGPENRRLRLGRFLQSTLPGSYNAGCFSYSWFSAATWGFHAEASSLGLRLDLSYSLSSICSSWAELESSSITAH